MHKFLFLTFITIIQITASSAVIGQQVEQNTTGEWILHQKDGTNRKLDPNSKSDLELIINQSKTNNEQSILELSDQIALDLRETENKLQNIASNLENTRIQKNLLEQSIKTEKSEMNPQELASNKTSLKTLKEQEKYLKLQKDISTGELQILKQITQLEATKQVEAYKDFSKNKAKQKNITPPPTFSNNPSNSFQSPQNQAPTKTITKKKKSAADFTKYNPDKDVMVNPPSLPCDIEFDGIDEFTNKKRKDHIYQTLFFLTPQPMLKNYPNKDYMSCQASLSAISGGTVFLNLAFSIASKDAGRLFGGFEKGTIINLKFLDGDNIAIINNRTDPGVFDTSTQTTQFRAQCNLGAGIQDKISKKSLDKIRVTWQTGYEDYEVFDVDLLVRQYKCLL